MRTERIIIILALGIGFMALGLSHSGAQETIKLGTVQPLTGGGSLFGLTAKQGLTLGFEDLNAKGGVKGKKVELIVYDSTTKPPVAATLTQRLIFEDKVPLILGSGSSLDDIAMMEVTEREKFPLLIPSAASPKITSMGYKWVWRMSLIDSVSAKILGDYVNKKPNWSKVAFLYENTEYGKPPVEVLKGIVERSKGKQVVAYETYNKGDTDVSAQLLKIKSVNPNVLFTWGYYTEAALIARQAQQIGLKAQLFGNQALSFPEYVELAGAAAEGVMFIESTSSGFNPDPKIVAFKKRYEAQFNRALYNTSVDCYDGAMIVGQILNKVGTKAQDIQKALNTMKFQGIAEEIKFDSTGQAQKGAIIFKVEGGKFKVVDRL